MIKLAGYGDRTKKSLAQNSWGWDYFLSSPYSYRDTSVCSVCSDFTSMSLQIISKQAKLEHSTGQSLKRSLIYLGAAGNSMTKVH